MSHLPVPARTAVYRRPPRGTPVAGTGQNVAPVGNHNGIPVLTVVVVDYAGQDRDTAAAQVWQEWTAHYPGALVQVVHGTDAWEPIR